MEVHTVLFSCCFASSLGMVCVLHFSLVVSWARCEYTYILFYVCIAHNLIMNVHMVDGHVTHLAYM